MTIRGTLSPKEYNVVRYTSENKYFNLNLQQPPWHPQQESAANKLSSTFFWHLNILGFSFFSETHNQSIRRLHELKRCQWKYNDYHLHIKLDFIYKCHLDWNRHQYSEGVAVTRFMFSNKSELFRSDLLWCPGIMLFMKCLLKTETDGNWTHVIITTTRGNKDDDQKQKITNLSVTWKK